MSSQESPLPLAGGDKPFSTPTFVLPPAFAEAASRRQASKGEDILGKFQISLVSLLKKYFIVLFNVSLPRKPPTVTQVGIQILRQNPRLLLESALVQTETGVTDLFVPYFYVIFKQLILIRLCFPL